MALSASPTVEVDGPSDILRLISAGTWLYNLSSCETPENSNFLTKGKIVISVKT